MVVVISFWTVVQMLVCLAWMVMLPIIVYYLLMVATPIVAPIAWWWTGERTVDFSRASIAKATTTLLFLLWMVHLYQEPSNRFYIKIVLFVLFMGSMFNKMYDNKIKGD